MNSYNRAKIITYILIIYTIAASVLLMDAVYVLFKTPHMPASSPIPVLSKSALNDVQAELDGRLNVATQSASTVLFGKSEPFAK